MSRPLVSLAYGRNVRVNALLDGRVDVEGLDVITSNVHMSELAWRQLRRVGGRQGEFDVAEMSLSSLLISIDRGESEFVALPVFTTRKFFHSGIQVRVGAGIDTPRDLIGRRVGIPEYQQTGALWIRHVLATEFGVQPTDMEWWMGRSKHLSHGGATGFEVPNGVAMHYVDQHDDLGSMILRGDLDAVLMYNRQTLVDRSTADLEADPRIRTLFEDPIAEGVRSLKATGHFPINHVLTVRRELVEQHPWLSQNLYDAFVKAKSIGETALNADAHSYVVAGAMTGSTADAFPYGFRTNESTLDIVRKASHEQGLTSRVIDFEEIFVPEALAS